MTARDDILKLVLAHAKDTHSAKPFVAGKTPVLYAGQVFDGEETVAAVSAMLESWITLGAQGHALELELASYVDQAASLLVNSGSSANLVAVSTLTSHKNSARGRLVHGDEIITAAAGFPTTVYPILQCGAVPVFIDSDPVTGNAKVEQLAEALTERTKAVMLAHTLGNPFDVAAVKEFCRKHDLWLIEDNCDALGATYDGKITGSFGHISTQSFYPPHHMTMGEGGAVNVCSHKFAGIAKSFRDWGRDCWCACGKDDTCRNRFNWQLGELPEGYDHKYVYSHVGYNLKPLDIQAAIGRVQFGKLPQFIAARRRNWQTLRDGLADLGEFFDFMEPTANSVPSWFGFMMRVKPGAPFTRTELASHLDDKKIGNRALFGGNLVRQPVFVQLEKDRPKAFRVVSDLAGADELMNNAIFIGVYPGLTEPMISYMIESVREFCRR